eukprot:10687148-Ditylum_brightwellii.AAC.1
MTAMQSQCGVLATPATTEQISKKMKEKKEEKESKGGEKKYQPSNGFKIALSAMLSDEDFKTLEAQF